MLMRKLGRTGLKVAALCLGGNTFGWTTDQKASEAVLDAYVEAGGNFIDTADVYSRWAPGNKGGESEDALGIVDGGAQEPRTRSSSPPRSAARWGRARTTRGLSRQHIMEGVEASLRRLQTDYIDLYQAHWDDRETPLDETLRAFDDLVRQGKVRYLGCLQLPGLAAHPRALGERQARLRALRVLQPKYNLVFRDEYERELEPLCLEQGVGVIPYSSLGSGFLSGKYRRGADAALDRARRRRREAYMNERGFARPGGGREGRGGGQRHARRRSRCPGSPTGPASPRRSPARPRWRSSRSWSAASSSLDAEATAALDQASAWREA